MSTTPEENLFKNDVNPETFIDLDTENILEHVKVHFQDKFEIQNTDLKYCVMVENSI